MCAPDTFCKQTAEGAWNLPGKYEGRPSGAALRNLEMVAGVGFEPTTFGL